VWPVVFEENIPVRWHYRDASLLWLFVAAYAIHMAEEWLGGFPGWVRLVVGSPLPRVAYVIINGVAFVLLVVGLRAAMKSEKYGWVSVAVAVVALVNTAAHAAGAMMTRTYSPGLSSAVVLYIPLGALVMIRAGDQAPPRQFARGIVAGLAIHAVVFVVAFAATRAG
jgi:hypothetical protein